MNRYQELSPNSMTEEGLKSLLAFQSILMNLATSFIIIPLQEIDDTIEQMLASVGAFTQVDRACFYRYDFEAGEARLSHEWKRQSIGPLPAQRRRMLLEGWLEDWSRQHQQGQVIYAESSQKDEGQTKLAAHLAEMGVKNAVSLPVMNQTDCLGFICFEAMTKRLDWRQKELDLLKVVAGLVSNALTRQAHERALTESKRRAEEKSREKSHFLADMSHEIRTPMNGIIGFLDLLSQTELDEDQAFFVREVQDASESLLSLLNDILYFSKIEAGKLELDNHTMDLHRVVESVASIFALKAQEKGVEIHTVIDPAVPQRVNGDSGKLRQILTNLVSNAVKFTERGAISISVHRQKRQDEMIALEINVKDTGIGISKEARQRLFQFFSQAEISTNRKYGGTGLGLAITKRLVEMQGGTVQVSSEPGAGTTFTVQLVYHQVENDANQQKEKEDLEGLRLMLVDDSQVSRAVIHTYLNEAGAVVTEVPGGVEALKLLLAMEPHKLPQIILTDYQMPDLDGLELGIQVKGTPSLEKIPLVMITSATLAAKVAAIKNHPFEGFLYKPVRKSELVDMMTKIAGKKQLRKHLQGIKDIEKAGLSNASRGRLLLVEDLPSNQKLAIITLGRMGYQVELAENGLIALEKCQTTTYDAILMDCQMPVMDGYEASWRIRTEGGPNAHTPIIAMTANAMEGERQKCLEAGMNDYVTKPFRRKPLEEVLTHYMKKGDR